MTDRGKFICRIPSREEMIRRWDDEIALHADQRNWITWKDEAIRGFLEGRSIPWYGFLDGEIICEATAVPDPAESGTVELCAFRTVIAFRGQGYFSKLMALMLKELKRRGFTQAVVGVEPGETRNRAIYHHWGFDELIRTGTETYPDGTVIQVEFYGKRL